MQIVSQAATSDSQELVESNVQHDLGMSSTPQSLNSSPTKSETETYSELISDSSDSEEDDDDLESFLNNQSELDEEFYLEHPNFHSPTDSDYSSDSDTKARMDALLEAAGLENLSIWDKEHLPNLETLQQLTSELISVLDEVAATLTHKHNGNSCSQPEIRRD